MFFLLFRRSAKKPNPSNLLKALTLPIMALVLLAGNATSHEVSRTEPVVGANETKSFYSFTGLTPGQTYELGMTGLAYRKQVRSDACGIYTLRVPKPMVPNEPGEKTLIFDTLNASEGGIEWGGYYRRFYSWSTTDLSNKRPKCVNGQYEGTQWTTSDGTGDLYYVWRDDNEVVFWRSSNAPYNDSSLWLSDDEWPPQYTLTRKIKANACGVARYTLKYPAFGQIGQGNFYQGNGWVPWDSAPGWTFNGVTYSDIWSQSPVKPSPICNKGLLYSPTN
jgi:hypothetical protein